MSTSKKEYIFPENISSLKDRIIFIEKLIKKDNLKNTPCNLLNELLSSWHGSEKTMLYEAINSKCINVTILSLKNHILSNLTLKDKVKLLEKHLINEKDPNLVDENNPEHVSWDLLEVLGMEKKEELDTVDEDGRTLLHYAAATGSVHLATLLAQYGVSTEIPDCFGMTPLHWIDNYGSTKNHETIRCLLLVYCGANQTNRNVTLETIPTEVLGEHILSRLGNTNGDLCPIFKTQNTHLIESMAKHTSKHNNSTRVKYILDCGWCFSELSWQHRDDPSPEELKEHKAVICRALKFLAVKKCDLNTEDKDGNTLLNAAAASGYIYLVQFLLSHGADTEIKDDFLKTPLINALENKHMDAAMLLMSHEADMFCIDVNGNSPSSLMITMQKKELEAEQQRQQKELERQRLQKLRIQAGNEARIRRQQEKALRVRIEHEVRQAREFPTFGFSRSGHFDSTYERSIRKKITAEVEREEREERRQREFERQQRAIYRPWETPTYYYNPYLR